VSLDGQLRPVSGVLPMALAAKKEGIQALFVPAENAAEATLAHGPAVYGIHNVNELAEALNGERQLTEEPIWVPTVDEEAVLDYYLKKGEKLDCVPVSRVSDQYPLILRKRLGADSPGVLWAKGDPCLLSTPTVSLVGSRELYDRNREFAAEVGRQAALQGYTLVSGNARGADKTAQRACLEAGGAVIAVVADSLEIHSAKENVLYLSEDSFDEDFSAQRALSRNRVIHGLGLKTFVAQSTLKAGGTWDGTVKNLRFGWSPVFCFDDGSEAATRLEQMGASLIGMKDLQSIYDLQEMTENIFDR